MNSRSCSTFGGGCREREIELAEGEIPNNEKSSKGLGNVLFETVGSLSYLVGSLVLITIAVGTIGGILISTKRLIQVKRTRSDEDDSVSNRKDEVGDITSNG